MQRLEVSGAGRPLYGSLGVKGLTRLTVTGSSSDVGQPVASYVLGCGSSHRVSPESPDTLYFTTETLHVR